RYPASLFEKQIKPARGRQLGCRARRAARSPRLRVVCAPRYRILAGDEKSVARYNLGRANTSFNRSANCELLIAGLSWFPSLSAPGQLRRYAASLIEKKYKPARDLSLAHGARLAACCLS